MDYDGPGPFGGFARGATMIIGGLLWLFMLLVLIALIFLLVRFLLVATKAAQIYVAKNSPRGDEHPPAAAATPTDTASVAPSPSVAPPQKPAPRPRTPKAP